MVASEGSSMRLIKPHRKSRAGCGNCKLRKVKCDEGKPTCKKCKASSYLCNYGGNNAALELCANDATRLKAFDILSFSLDPAKSLGVSRYVFEQHDVDLLSRFRNRTILTVTTDRNRRVYQDHIVEIAPQYPFLMHSLLALTSMHDRYLSGSHNQPRPAREAFHQYRTIALFNARLAKSVQPSPSESAALWVTAVLLSTTTFCRIEATTPEEAWPLKQPSPSDLSWVTMGEGKTRLWNMTRPFTSEARFQGLVPPSIKGIIPKSSTQSDLNGLPSGLIKLCDLDLVANDKNPYHAVAATLAKAIHIDYVSRLLSFLILISNIPPDYKLLLKQKDPRALLLLAYWYAKLCEVEVWWLRPRALLEGHATCIYLRRYHSDDSELQDVMRSLWTTLHNGLLGCRSEFE